MIHIPVKVRRCDFCEKWEETDDRSERLVDNGDDVQRNSKFAE
jgi:hypothetical protein